MPYKVIRAFRDASSGVVRPIDSEYVDKDGGQARELVAQGLIAETAVVDKEGETAVTPPITEKAVATPATETATAKKGK